MLPNYYEFQNSTKILSGEYALENIPTELKKRKAQRVLFLSDKTLEKIGTVQIVVDAVQNGSIEIVEKYIDIPADSDIEIINQIAQKYRKKNCDSIIAVGGGSVLDTAKGVRMVLSQKVEKIKDLMGAEIISYGEQVPFIAIPTTTGTGSEVTAVAVILDKIKKVKMEFISYFLLPDVAVIDPRMTKTLPAKMKASTGMDSLCHAIEAYTCLQKNPMSDAYAVSSMELIGENLIKEIEKPTQKTRLAMASASMMAGVSFSNSMVGLIHAIGHALGAVSHVPHGEAMNILIPFCMRYNMDKCKKQYSKILFYLAGEDEYFRTEKEKRADKTIEVIEKMKEKLNKKTGLPIRLNQAGVKKEDFHEIALRAINDGALIVNPKKVNYEDVLYILNQAF